MNGRNVGYIRQQTVNADFIICSKTGNFQKLDAHTIKVDAIESPTISQLTQQIDSLSKRVLELEKYIEREQAQNSSYQPGSCVATTLHFDDVDLDLTDRSAFEATLKETLAAAAGVDVDMIVLVDIAKTGSATVRVEIKYPEGQDTSKKTNLIESLGSSDGINSILGGLGEVQAEEVQPDIPILSMDSKIFQLEQMIGKFRDTVNLQGQSELRIQDYRLRVEGDRLNIQRYDHDSDAYVGGNLVLDA
jgi:hypothetical protein